MKDKSIEQSLEINESDILIYNQGHIMGSEKIVETKFEINVKSKEQAEALKQQILTNQKLVNELKRTHDFYLKSKNGYCAGVTNQILELSNYGGKA